MNAHPVGDSGRVNHSPLRDHQAAATSQASEQPNYRLRYQELFDFAWDAQAVTDPTGIILEANHAVAALFGCSKEFLVGKPLALLLRAGARRLYQSLIALARTAQPQEFECRVTRDGRAREISIRGMVEPPLKGPWTIRWQIRDISSHKHAERAHRALLVRLVGSQENERRRISREIHDQLGQELTAITLGLKSLESDLAEGAPGRQRLRELQQAVDRLGRQTHDLAFELRPAALDDLGLRAALEGLIRRWSGRVGIPVGFRFAAPGSCRFSPQVESAVYRMIQEALTNVARHARATRVSVIVERDETHLMALVEDDGQGFDPELCRREQQTWAAGHVRAALTGGRDAANRIGPWQRHHATDPHST